MQRNIEVAVSVLLNIVDSEHCSIKRTKYPLERLLEVLSHNAFSYKCKTETMIVLGELIDQSEHVAITLVKQLNLLRVITVKASSKTDGLNEDVYLQILTRLTAIPQLLSDLECLATSALIRFRMEDHSRTKVLLLQFVLHYIYCAVCEHRCIHKKTAEMLEVLAQEDEELLTGEDVEFWRRMVDEWNYHGHLPRFFLESDAYQ